MNMKEEEKINQNDTDASTAQDTAAAEETTENADTATADTQNDNPGTDTDTSADTGSAADDKQEPEPDPLEQAKAEVDMWKDKYLRSVAEFDNYRKRTIKEKTELILNGSEQAVKAVLPVVDDMERAMASAANTDDVKALKDGMELIFQKLNKSLGTLGVKKIDTADADFDTEYHEAIAMVPGVADDKKGKVIDCVEAGYTLNDKVIRHAKVAVGQ